MYVLHTFNPTNAKTQFKPPTLTYNSIIATSSRHKINTLLQCFPRTFHGLVQINLLSCHIAIPIPHCHVLVSLLRIYTQ